ncbi:MAG: RluA family pseudouridine synthase [Candidatus Dependentiae bacterium]
MPYTNNNNQHFTQCSTIFMEQHTFVVTDEQLAGDTTLRLDTYLTEMLHHEISRAQLATQVKNGAVTINNKAITKPGYKVRIGDMVVYTPAPQPVFDVQPQHVDFDVIAEEKDFIIINKPAGLVVHHSHTAPGEVTLVHGLLHRFPAFANFDSTERAGIVHRLDKDTSGIMLIARTPAALTKLAALFKERTIKKTYTAIVMGHPSRSGEITQPIGRHPVHRHKMTVGGIAPREAATRYEVKTYFEDHTLLQLYPETGRTHQIRVHCHYIGHPLLADTVYGKSSLLLKRHALHAAQLSFTYDGTSYIFFAPLPADMQRVVATLPQAENDEETV